MNWGDNAEWLDHGLTEHDRVDVDGHVDARGIRYIGTAVRQPDGTYHCLANVLGALCRVEVQLRLP